MRRFKHVYYNFLFSIMQKPFLTGLKLKNSLTNQLEQFQPRNGRNVRWYSCGPTVYSHSHLGHARNYVCNDMVRRVMRDYFGYNVQLCMNITDVDDKIINRSNEEGIQYFEFARRWQQSFFQDMKSLGVQNPNYLTRVTQHVPQIVKFIERIIENGYAYPAKGSVYFDIKQYQTKFKYGKLKRVKGAQTEAAQVEESGKKNKQDFALWKAAKPGEPTWPSPWGDGRPGWHIQCSAMADSILGQHMDIHSGGIDLIFPHHQNQMAQSQAHNNNPDWVRYFIHVGHLNIFDPTTQQSLKMSKSLKNFLTIKDIIKFVSVRILKLYFFIHKYDVVLTYDPQKSLQQSEAKDKRYKNFFGNLNTAIRQSVISVSQKMTAQDLQFDKLLQNTQNRIYESFCDNINTPDVIAQIDQVVKHTNTYLQRKDRKLALLEKALNIAMRPLKSMGLDYSTVQSASNQTNIIDAATKFRDEIRVNAKSDFKKILEICDHFRDYEMVDLNIRLQDKNIGEPSSWKYESKEVLISERQKKIQQKAKKQLEKKKKQQQKLKKMSRKPQEMFRDDPKYSEFDENGIPTHENKKQKVKGQNQKDKHIMVSKPLDNKLRKKLQKQWNQQKGQYQKWKQLKKQQ